MERNTRIGTVMTRSDNRRIVEAARTSFDAILHSPEFHRAHGDDAQLELLIGYLGIAAGSRYLDLGTGNGYAAFAIAARQPDCLVTGLDIARRAIARNAELARERGLANAAFEVMDGINLRVPAAAFDGVVCRYALHHFPDLCATLGDVNRGTEARRPAGHRRSGDRRRRRPRLHQPLPGVAARRSRAQLSQGPADRLDRRPRLRAPPIRDDRDFLHPPLRTRHPSAVAGNAGPCP